MRQHEIFIAVRTEQYVLQERRVRTIVEAILAATQRPKCWLNVIFVSDQSMIAHNKRVFGKNRSTDVISFPWLTPFAVSKSGHFLGDVLISLDRAYYRATDFNHSFNEEVITYMIHGILHLIGYDDVTAAMKKAMFAEQDKVFQRLTKQGLLQKTVAMRK